MIADLGYIALLFAFITAVYSAFAAWYGRRSDNWRWVESARNATVITLPLVALSAALLITLLLQDDFSIEYVWRVSSIEQPTYLKVTALWGGQAGSLLFWNLLLAIFTAAAMFRKWDEQKPLMPYALMVASFTQIFFLMLSAFVENPFARITGMIPANGNGLNPLLRHPGMIIHPPMLYLGFTGFTIPYTFAVAALMSGKLDDTWIRTTRRWTLVAWLFLSLGLILGGRWAYDVLGWGGYWGWDPVENASLIPWLSGTAFLHSVMIQEKRDMFKVWNMFLIIVTYALVILGTFVVRSGVISSVHSFAESAVGPLFFGFIAVMFIFSAYWLNKRREELAGKNSLTSFFSREAAFLYNNFLILAILVITFLFTYYPIISELFTGERGFVGPPVYEKALAPLFALLLLLMGVAPLTMWYRTSMNRLQKAMLWPFIIATTTIIVLFFLNIRHWAALVGFWVVTFAVVLTLMEFGKGTRARMKHGENVFVAFSNLMARNRRRYGGYWIHMGVLIMAVGIIGVELYQEETQQLMQIGDKISLGRYEMQLLGVQQYEGPDDLIITEATVDVYDNGDLVATLTPRREIYTRTGQPMTIPKARSTIAEDFYVLLAEQPTSPNAAIMRVFLNPMINWVWAGGFVFVLGTLIAAWPDAVEDRITAVRARRRPAIAVAGD
ncbi:MAG: heme lyase CcmF/NrfE family subunit [Ardenticatenaceae bacterium]|nr:heme lyase CcmF/NrfE family subunit [Anaerolineales bacterium]MCB8923209.1 heme lyase CcmF/NrfE family subunit [Ardenticatenaceae bacterium]MCB9004846.1 heme lyase CcmF/NrfE family subunit [Ardenticatenaceae bacterium]